MVWSVCALRPIPHAADIAIANLTRQGYPTFNPCYALRKVRRNKTETVSTPLFLNYLFVHVDIEGGQRWVPAGNTLGVQQLLTRKSSRHEWLEPAPISDSFITQLKQCSDRTGDAAWCLKPGTRVKILRGPLINHHALVEWSDQQRVRLLLEILGRTDVSVTLDAADVLADPALR